MLSSSQSLYRTIGQESSPSEDNGIFLLPPALPLLPGTITKSTLLTEEIVHQRQRKLKCVRNATSMLNIKC